MCTCSGLIRAEIVDQPIMMATKSTSRTDAFWEFVYFAMSMAQEEAGSYAKHEHDYMVETEICRTDASLVYVGKYCLLGATLPRTGQTRGLRPTGTKRRSVDA